LTPQPIAGPKAITSDTQVACELGVIALISVDQDKLSNHRSLSSSEVNLGKIQLFASSSP